MPGFIHPYLGKPSPVITTLSAPAGDATDLTTYTFSSVDFGTARPDRVIVVAIGSRANASRSLSSVTIGGVTATVIVANSTGGGADIAALAYAQVPTGATGNIVITFSGAMLRCIIGQVSIINPRFPTAYHTNTAVGTNNPRSTTLNIPINGVAVAAGWCGSSGTASGTWTGVTKIADLSVESASVCLSYGTYTGPFEASRSISVNINLQLSDNALAVASWE